jgi:enoyl-CoA hydratase/carnithine racemase
MELSTVTYARDGGIARIVLNRPAQLNAISPLLLEELDRVCEAVEGDPSVRAVTLTAAGRVFCAGADLTAVRELVPDAERWSAFMRLWRRVFSRIEALPVPVVAGVHGLALAGGLELLLVADLVVMDATARLGDQHANFGLVAGGGGSQRLPRLIGARRAKELMLLGGWLDAAQALAWGLVNRVVPAGGVSAAVEELGRTLAQKSGAASRTAKRLVDQGLDMSLADGLELELRLAGEHMRSPDAAEGLAAFAERRPPVFSARCGRPRVP